VGVGPKADLVDYHRRHRDGVAAAAGPVGRQLLTRFGDLVELETEQPAMLVDPGQQQLPDRELNCRFVNLPAGYSVTIV
jgi:hypothetical protein